MFPYDHHGESNETRTLSEHITQLRASCGAAARFQGGHTYHAEEVAIFRGYAEREGIYITEPPPTLATPPSDEGNEHQVWHMEGLDIYLKATWPDNFGMKVIHRPHDEPSASPIDYLERWALHNEFFGDSVKFIGALDTDRGLRLIISQPAIKGSPATVAQINDFFLSYGWRKLSIGQDIAYLDVENCVAISDTHQGNIIAVRDGDLLLPIDLRVQRLDRALMAAAQQYMI